jgi:DNA-binding NarL/FixJ family response regulator
MQERIRVLAIDDHAVVRAGLAALIDDEPDMTLVGQAANAEEALRAFRTLRPDVTLMDLRLPETSGIELMERLQQEQPGARVIIFSNYAREGEIYEAHKRGAWGYVRKGAPAEELLRAIRVVHAGHRYMTPDVAGQVVDHIAHDDLSLREREVLQLMFEGRSNREIGLALAISEHTVNNHVRSVLAKLGAERRTEAIATALRKGILRVD